MRRFWLMLHEQRCGRCQRLLMKTEDDAIQGRIDIKCPRCKSFNTLRPLSPSPKRLDRDGKDPSCGSLSLQKT